MPKLTARRPTDQDGTIQQALSRLRLTQAFTPEMLGAIEQEMEQVFVRAQHLQRLEFYRADAAARGVMDLHG
jgi:hypothetical protein